MKVGADHSAGDDPLGPVAVADAGDDVADRRSTSAARRTPTMVLIAREGGHGGVDWVGGQLADGSAVAGCGYAVEQAEAWSCAAVRADELVAEDLQPGTDGENSCTSVDGPVEGAARFELRGGQRLGAVLPAAHDVDVGAVGNRLAQPDDLKLGLSAPPSQALSQDHCIAPVSVRAQQLRVHEGDPHGGVGGHDLASTGIALTR